jgi:hypothetical protein
MEALSHQRETCDGVAPRMPAALGIRGQGPEVTRICRSDPASPASHHPRDMRAELEYLHQKGKTDFSLEIEAHFRTMGMASV